MKFIILTEIYFSDENSSPRFKFIGLMKWWKFIPLDYEEFINLSDETLKGTCLGIVDSSLWWIFITLMKLKFHPSEFIAMIIIHYLDTKFITHIKVIVLMNNIVSSLIQKSTGWLIILFWWKFFALMKFIPLVKIRFSDENSSPT